MTWFSESKAVSSSYNSILSAPTLRSPITVMSSLPTISAPTTGATTIVNPQFISVFNGTSLNRLLRYPYGDIRKAADTWPRELCVSNFAVSNPTDGTVFVGGSYGGGSVVVEFQFDGTKIDIHTLGGGGAYRILVDEGTGFQYTNASAGNANGTLVADGSEYKIPITFATRAPRNIRFELERSLLMGVTIGGNDTVSPCTRPLLPKCVIIGDSFTEPTGATNSFTGWANIACQLLGWEASPSGSGGTGYLATGAVPRVNFRGRVITDVINQNPQYIIIAGGINDAAFTPAQIQAEAILLYQAIQQGLKDTQIIVVSNWFPRAPSATELAITTALRTAAATCKVPFIDTQNGTSYLGDGTQLVSPAMGSWMTGSGNTGATQTTGNASIYTGLDNTHPVQAGHTYLGYRVAQEIYRIYNTRRI